MKYEVILFDADGTLFDFDKSEEYAFEKTMGFFQLKYNKEIHLAQYQEINHVIWDEFEKEMISADQLKVERFRRFLNKLQISLSPEQFATRYLDFLCEVAFLLPGAVETLEAFSGKYKLGLITNGLSMVQNRRLKQSVILPFFQSVVISEEVGVAKPNAGIFEYALKELKQEKKESVLLVGDSIKSDIMGGVYYGIDTCWYNPKGQNKDLDIVPTYEIKSLFELKQIVEL